VSITQNCTDQFTSNVQYVLLTKNYKIQLKFHKARPYINLALSKWKCAVVWATLYIYKLVLSASRFLVTLVSFGKVRELDMILQGTTYIVDGYTYTDVSSYKMMFWFLLLHPR